MLGAEQNLPSLLKSLLSPSVISGDTGPQVEALQRDLTVAGFTVTITGTYDAATKATVEAFQQQVGIMPTGVVGARTRAALARAVETAKTQPAKAGVGLALASPVLVVSLGIAALIALGAVPRRRSRLGELTAHEAVTESLWRPVGIFPDEGVEVANRRTGQTRVIPFTAAREWIRHGRLEPITEEQIEGCNCAPKARQFGLVASFSPWVAEDAFETKSAAKARANEIERQEHVITRIRDEGPGVRLRYTIYTKQL